MKVKIPQRTRRTVAKDATHGGKDDFLSFNAERAGFQITRSKRILFKYSKGQYCLSQQKIGYTVVINLQTSFTRPQIVSCDFANYGLAVE